MLVQDSIQLDVDHQQTLLHGLSKQAWQAASVNLAWQLRSPGNFFSMSLYEAQVAADNVVMAGCASRRRICW